MASSRDSKPFIMTIPGILTGIAAIIVAVGSFYAAMNSSSANKEQEKSANQPVDTQMQVKATQPPAINQSNTGNNNDNIVSVGNGNTNIGKAENVTIGQSNAARLDTSKKNDTAKIKNEK